MLPLFVSDRTGGRVGDARKAFDAIARRAGLPARRLRSRTLRVSYIAHRLLSAAARAAVPKPERDRVETEQRREVIRAFLAAVVGLSSRAVQEATGIAYRTVGRLRTGEQTDARGETLRRMKAHLAERNEQAA